VANDPAMSAETGRRPPPEERELQRKLAELEAREAELAQQELELATLHAGLRDFETRYLLLVGAQYAELDEITAEVAEAEALLDPENAEIQERARRARRQAKESRAATGSAREAVPRKKFAPTETAKRLYRELARRIHPDLAGTGEERERRQQLMMAANRAYETGDEARLLALLEEWENSPEAVTGEGVVAELVRAIRKLAQAEDRVEAIAAAVGELQATETYELSLAADEAEQEGRDLLQEMAARLDEEIAAAKARLGDLQEKLGEP
jgi:hypothetical protein